MIWKPLKGGVGKYQGEGTLGVELRDIEHFERDAALDVFGLGVEQLVSRVDHRGRAVDSMRGAVRDASGEIESVLAGAASEVDYCFVVGEIEPRQDVLDGLGAVTPEAVVEFGIPIGHVASRLWGQHRGREIRSQAEL